ncbi:hypothetical protein HEK616_82280 (plasmid) [Streptomyces nigrescens]|uniref:Uncharacterized protein n=1 Tax=Streptomyces nigrescens TaxID=1920 RepID=A0ABM8A7L2_STRNI|nr:hypothetical protein HEK616_82280 [Streptomyces nigrescens]
MLDQCDVRGPVGREAQVGLVDVTQPSVLQRVDPADHGGVADVAAAGDQERGDRDVQVLQPRLAAGDRRDRLVGAGPGEHLQQDLFEFRLQRGQVQPPVVVEDDLRVVR